VVCHWSPPILRYIIPPPQLDRPSGVPHNAGMNPPPEPLDPSYRPKLRPEVAAEAADGGVVFFDQFRIGRPVQLTPLGVELARRFDGRTSLRDIQSTLMRRLGGRLVPLDVITGLVRGL